MTVLSKVRAIFVRLFRTRRPFKLTGPGWVFILYTIGVGAGAINTGNNLLYLVFGIFLGLILASGFLSDLSLWGIDVEPAFPLSTEMGRPVSIFFTVTNNKRWLPSLCLNILVEGDVRGKPFHLTLHVPHVGAGASVVARVEGTPPARGWLSVRRLRVTTRYPFGLLEKWWRLRVEENADPESLVGQNDGGFFVTPKKFPVRTEQIPFYSAGEEVLRESYERGDGTTLVGLRGYLPGDNPRRIHWKATAKRASIIDGSGWLVREMEKDQREETLLVCPSPQECAGLSDEKAEDLVSFLASVIDAGERENFRWVLLINGQLVTDTVAFLSLWSPKVPLTGAAERTVRPVPEDFLRESRRTLKILEAYLAARA